MSDILAVILPVFMVIGLGAALYWRGIVGPAQSDALTKYAVQIGLPVLLFRAVSGLDLAQAFDPNLFLSYYLPALFIFVSTSILSAKLFKRTPGQSVIIGFSALFSNMVLIGLPIAERAYGPEALATSYAILSVHAPFCYIIGIASVEILRRDGKSVGATAQTVLHTIFKNMLTMAILAGFIVNLSGIAMPGVVKSALNLIADSSLPVALFALGTALIQYSRWANIPESLMSSVMKVILFPTLVYLAGRYVFPVEGQAFKNMVLASAMASGLNSYMLAAMYDRAKDTAACTVMVSTILSIFTLTGWLWLLG